VGLERSAIAKTNEAFVWFVTDPPPAVLSYRGTGPLTVRLVARIADDLLATDYRLPVLPGQFESWAREQGWI
jgi:hypothetical protein